MATVNIDKQSFDFCTIDLESFLEETLGQPLVLTNELEELLCNSWAVECEEDLLEYFKAQHPDSASYEQVHRDNTYNHESDLDSFFVYTVYAPKGCRDWVWEDGCYVTVEIGGAGDPRYVPYSNAQVYYVSGPLAETGFFNWMIGWVVEPLPRYPELNNDIVLEQLRMELDQGYSSNPTYELREKTFAEPVWSEKRQGYVARFVNMRQPVVLTPFHYTY
jgi:hypothetical protein